MRKVLILLAIVSGLSASLSGCIDIPRSQKPQPVRKVAPYAPPRPETRQCLAKLGATQASFTPLPDRSFGAGCSNIGTVQLAGLQSDSAMLALSNLGPVTCKMAEVFAGWARFGADRAATQILGSRLAKIETYGSYNCRNVAGSNRRSGHATANAIDISAFVLADGRRVSVLDDWSNGTPAERRFLRVVHESACKRFGTTLGPNYNAAHKNHFHLEADGANFCR